MTSKTGIGALAIVGLLGISGVAIAHPTPRNFNECLLTYLPGTDSDRASAAIERACAQEFPAASPTAPTDHRSRPQPGSTAPIQQQPGANGGAAALSTSPAVAPASAPPIIRITGRHLRNIAVDPRNYRIFPEGVQQVVELLVHNRGTVFTIRELVLKVHGIRLGSDEFGVATDIPPESSAVVRIRMPKADLRRARFDVEDARGVQFRG